MTDIITIKKAQDVDILSLSFNEINLEQREQLKKKMMDLLDTGVTRFIIDLSGVGFLSSLVIATIVFFSKEVYRKNGKMKLSGLSNEASSILQLTQLDKIFEVYNTEQEALESFNRSS